MDLERIKQNLRLRSGCPKKKPTIQERRSATVNADRPQPPPSAPAPARTPMKDQYSQTEQEKVAVERQADPQSDQKGNGHSETAQTPQPATEAVPKSRANGLQESDKTKPGTWASEDSDGADFDLRPPAPRARLPSLETTSELLFSSGHLNSILHDPQSISRFTAFLNRYRPEYQPLIVRYLETQKAIRAVEYANAVAAGAEATNQADVKDVQKSVPGSAARLDEAFEKASTAAFKALVGEALPQYITYNLIKIASECLINEVAGRQSVIMQSLVGGLSEVFCLTDPNLPDNPIIYASEEFYRYTGYGSEDVIGSNCRFLQGPKTLRDSPRRIKEATESGTEICETLLNYRRDGRPFINLLMIAPLHDNKGRVKYQIGAQVDVSGLVEKGRGLDTFAQYLTSRNNDRGRRSVIDGDERKQNALNKLRELSEMFDLEESAVVQTHSRANSSTRSDDSRSIGGRDRPKAMRRLFVSDSDSDRDDNEDDITQASKEGAWKLGWEGPQGKPSGKLPGIYDSYMLIRPAPSLRIIFVSPKLQKQVKTVQSPFLSHVAAPPRTLAGLKESFLAGVPVSAKINFMASPGERRDGVKVSNGYSHDDGKYGKACWISATPLLGSDDHPGVWMVVLVDKSKVPKGGATRSAEVEAKTQAEASSVSNAHKPEQRSQGPSNIKRSEAKKTAQPKDGLPIKPKRLASMQATPSKPTEDAQHVATSDAETDDYHEAQAEHPEAADHSSETLIDQPPSPTHAEDGQPWASSGTQTPNIKSQDSVAIQPSPDHEKQQRKFEQQHTQAQSQSQGANNDAQPPQTATQQRSDIDDGYNLTPNLKLDLREQRKFTPPPDIDSSLLSKTPRTEEGERTELKNGQSQDNDNGDGNGNANANGGSEEGLENTPIATRTYTRRSSGDMNVKARGEPQREQQVQAPASEHQSPPAADGAQDSQAAEQGEGEIERKGDGTGEHEWQWSPAGKEVEAEQRPAMRRDPNGPSGFAIDYLAHPGSGGVGGGGRRNKRVHAEEFGRALQERDGDRGRDDGDDSDCLRTPYSVD